jgi:cobalt/nickel transport system ATP-binding protein
MLTVRDLTVSYPGRERAAVDGLSFDLRRGESVALIGANGAGKTTLLLALVGVTDILGGSISVDGTAVDKHTLREARRKIGFVFQNPDDQLFMPSIFEDAAFGPRSFGLPEAEARASAEEALSGLGISHIAQQSPLKLSGGEKRLAAIATVLAMRPDYILLDEPTAFLDPRAKRVLGGILSELPQGRLIATHDLSFAEQNCSRVLLLRGGRLAADGGLTLLRDTRLLESAGL